jgi:YD repeat-containing protein
VVAAGISRYSDSGQQLVATSSFNYDNAGRLTSLSHSRNGNPIAQYTWTFDAAHRLR